MVCVWLTGVSRTPASSTQSLGHIKQTETSRHHSLGLRFSPHLLSVHRNGLFCFVEDPEIVTVLSRGHGQGKSICTPSEEWKFSAEVTVEPAAAGGGQ